MACSIFSSAPEKDPLAEFTAPFEEWVRGMPHNQSNFTVLTLQQIIKTVFRI